MYMFITSSESWQEIPDLDFEQASSITALGYNVEYGNKNYMITIDSTMARSEKIQF